MTYVKKNERSGKPKINWKIFNSKQSKIGIHLLGPQHFSLSDQIYPSNG